MRKEYIYIFAPVVVETQKFIARSTSKYVARLFIDIVKCFFMYFNVLWGWGSFSRFFFACMCHSKGVFMEISYPTQGILHLCEMWKFHVCYTIHILKSESINFFLLQLGIWRFISVCVCVCIHNELNYGAFAYSLIIYFDYVIYFHHALSHWLASNKKCFLFL